MSAPGLDRTNLDHELNRTRHACGAVTHRDSVGLVAQGSAPTRAAERVALVIGNTAYEHTRVLPNARNDATAIAALLKTMGFEVTEATDLGYRGLREAIRNFGAAAQESEMAVVYYAGHGLEVAGENYLVPTDARIASDADLEYEAVTLASLLDSVRIQRKFTLVILDACRINPLADRMRLRAGTARSVSRGLARIEPTGDILVAYAAKAGTLARDGEGANSPYAQALLKHLGTPGLDIRLVMGRVRDMVLESTGNEQEPYTYGSLPGTEISLVPSTSLASLDASTSDSSAGGPIAADIGKTAPNSSGPFSESESAPTEPQPSEEAARVEALKKESEIEAALSKTWRQVCTEARSASQAKGLLRERNIGFTSRAVDMADRSCLSP